MNRNPISFDWNRTRAFLVTVEKGSLSAAARSLGVSQSTLSRQVAALEEELGVRLFERTAGALELTPVGWKLLDLAREMGDAAQQISLVTTSQSQDISGPICLSATDTVAARLLPPVVEKYTPQSPVSGSKSYPPTFR